MTGTFKRELAKTALCIVAMLILAVLIVWTDGERGVEELKRFGTIFGGILLVAIVAVGSVGLVAYRRRKTSERRHAERAARMTFWPEDVVRNLLRDLLPVDFFESLEGLSEDDAVRQAINTIGKRFDPDDERARRTFEDVLLIEYLDSNVISWLDLECDVCDVNDAYRKWFGELARISRGAFWPTKISETWETPEGPIRVAFTLNRKSQSVSPKYIDDWLDLSLLHALNDVIQISGRQFEVVTRTDQTACVLCLTSSQKAALLRRGWEFETRFETHPEDTLAGKIKA